MHLGRENAKVIVFILALFVKVSGRSGGPVEVKVVANPKKADRFFSELNYVVPREEFQVA